METISVKEFGIYFPSIMKKIEKGNRVSISHDRTRKPLAMIIPCVEKKPAKRKIGILDGKIKIEFKDDFKMTTEELFEIQ